jgi:hypothetical protein
MSTAHSAAAHDHPRRRRLTLDVWRNPLARGVDRAEATLLILAIGMWLLAVPVLAAAGSVCWPDVAAAAADQQRTRSSAPAVLAADAVDFVFGEHGIPISGHVPVPARWVTPDGSERTGTVSATGGAKSGDTVQVWIDRSGNPTAAPITTTAAATLVILTAAGAWLALGALLGASWLIVRWRLGRRRLADWDRDWQRVEPRWSGRRP